MSQSPIAIAIAIVVFDAQCLLCSAWVQFLLKRDRNRVFRFASIQGEYGKKLLRDAGLKVDRLDTLLLVDGGHSYQHTEAILRVLKQLGWPWRVAALARIVPSPLRDTLYRFFARRRYQIFGRSDECFLPRSEDLARFLD